MKKPLIILLMLGLASCMGSQGELKPSEMSTNGWIDAFIVIVVVLTISAGYIIEKLKDKD